jgi:hypothetical protein
MLLNLNQKFGILIILKLLTPQPTEYETLIKLLIQASWVQEHLQIRLTKMGNRQLSQKNGFQKPTIPNN